VPRVSTVTGRRVFGAGGRQLGRVSEVLFHPSEPRVVGIQIQPDPFFYVVSRRPRFALISEVEAVGADALRLSADRLPADGAGERALGYSWQDTVVWQGMPVHLGTGDAIGIVHDVVFPSASYAVSRLVVSTGVLGDAALGRLEVDGRFVGGFEGDRVIVMPGYDELRAPGGAAKTAAAGVAMARIHGGRLASSALKSGAAAAAVVGRSFKQGAGKRAIDKIKSLMDDGE